MQCLKCEQAGGSRSTAITVQQHHFAIQGGACFGSTKKEHVETAWHAQAKRQSVQFSNNISKLYTFKIQPLIILNKMK